MACSYLPALQEHQAAAIAGPGAGMVPSVPGRIAGSPRYRDFAIFLASFPQFLRDFVIFLWTLAFVRLNILKTVLHWPFFIAFHNLEYGPVIISGIFGFIIEHCGVRA